MPLLRTSLALAFVAFAAPAFAQTCTSPIPASDLTVPGKLQLSINPTLPPLQSVDSKGELQGLNVELGKEIAKRLCLEMDFQRMDFPSMIPALKAGRFDGIDTGNFWTEERSKIMFTVPYALSAIGVVVTNESKYKPADPKELLGHTIALESDSYQERWVRTFSKENVEKDPGAKPIEVRAFITATEVIAALRAGQVEVAALPAYTAVEVAKRGQVALTIKAMGATPIMMGFRKKSVADAVAKAFNDMKADGTYDKLLDAVGVPPLPASDLPFAIRGPGPSS